MPGTGTSSAFRSGALVHAPFITRPRERQGVGLFTITPLIHIPPLVWDVRRAPVHPFLFGRAKGEPASNRFTWIRPPWKHVAPVPGNVPLPIAIRHRFPLPSPIRRTCATFAVPLPSSTTSGVRILFHRGPAAHAPTAQSGEPLWMTDTHQAFVGDGFANHFIGGDFVSAPAHHNSPGVAGQQAWDGTNYYKCVGSGAWIQFLPAGGFSSSF